jgi:Stress responsive A/B Barrel Domain
MIPEIRKFVVCEDAGNDPRYSGFGVVADFDDIESYEIYKRHPDHIAVHEEVVDHVIGSAMSMQFDWPEGADI